jgi:hypothetical protein
MTKQPLQGDIPFDKPIHLEGRFNKVHTVNSNRSTQIPLVDKNKKKGVKVGLEDPNQTKKEVIEPRLRKNKEKNILGDGICKLLIRNKKMQMKPAAMVSPAFPNTAHNYRSIYFFSLKK